MHFGSNKGNVAFQVLRGMSYDELFLGLNAALILCHKFVKILNRDTLGRVFVDKVEHDTLENLGIFRMLGPLVLNSAKFAMDKLFFLVIVGSSQVIEKSCADDCSSNCEYF